MKKRTYQLISLILTVALLLSGMVIPATAEGTSFAVSASGTTRIEGEDFTASTREDLAVGSLNSSANGAILLGVAPGVDTKFTASYPLTVAESGYYTVRAAGSLNDNNTEWSAWGFYANSDTNSANIQSAQGTPFHINGLGDNAGDVYYCGVVYLEAGENTLYWWFKRRTKAVAGVAKCIYAALDYVELTPNTAATVASSGTTKIEGESLTGSTHSGVTVAGLGGGRYGAKIKTTSETTDTYTISYTLNVAEAGNYDLRVAGSDRANSGLSQWSVYANDTTNVASGYTSEGGEKFNGGFGTSTGDTFHCGKIHLNEGVNTLYFKYGRNNSSDKRLWMAVDYFELTAPAATSVATVGTTRIEGENYTNTTHTGLTAGSISDGGVNGAKILAAEETTNTKYTASYKINVAEAGMYGIKARASLKGNGNLSDWTLYVNSPSNKPSSYTAEGDLFRVYGIGADTGDTYDCGRVHLDAGINTIYWSFGKDASRNQIDAVLDYIELTAPEMAATTVASTGTTRIEGEDFTDTTHTSVETGSINANAQGAKILNVDETTNAKYTVFYTLNVAEAGYYSLKAAGSLKNNSDLSDWTLYVNNAQTAPASYTAEGNTFQIYGIGGSAGDVYDCGRIYLPAGLNTLYWSFGKASGRDKIYAVLDYVELTATPAVSVASTGTTRIEGENFNATTHESVTDGAINSGANGAKILDVDETTSATYTVSYKLNVSEAGYYSLRVAGSLKSNTNLSDWTLYVNNPSNTPASYTAQGVTFRVNGIGDNTGDVYDCGKIYLSQGENTLYWKFGKASGRDKIFAALDYVELIAPSAVSVAATGTTRIEGENYVNATHASIEAGSVNADAMGAKIMNVEETTSQKYTTSYTINVAEAGYYGLKAAGSVKGNTSYSDWTVYANDAANAPSTYSAMGQTFRVYGIGADAGDIYDFGRIYLSQGANTLYWSFGKASGQDKLYAALDYIELTAPGTTVASTGTTRIEGENYLATTHASVSAGSINPSAYGAKILNVDETTSDTYTVSYSLNVVEAGYYDLKAAGSIRDNLRSAWTIYVNDPSNAPASYTATGETFQVYGIGPSAGDIYNCGKVYLSAGENTLYWKFGKAAEQDKIYAALDYVELTAHTTTTVAATGTTRIEGESYAESTHASVESGSINPNAHGAKILNVDETSNTKYTVSYTLNVLEAGYYGVTAAASLKGNTDLSEWTIYVNNAQNAPASYTAAGETFQIYGIGSAAGDKYDCDKVYLNAGENTLYWSFEKASGRDKLYAALDYIELTRLQMITVPASGTTKIEGEDYTDATITPNVRVMNDPDDGQKAVNYVSFNPSHHTGEEFIVKFALDVASEGYYDLSAVATIRSQTYTSDWFIYADTPENSVVSYTQGADVTTTSFMKNNFKEFDCGSIYLDAGLNILCWKVDETDAPNGVLQAALDYITLTPSAPQTVTIGDETYVEAETNAKPIRSWGASGDRVMGVISENKSNTISLIVTTAGDYMIEVSGTDGKVSISLDGGSPVTLGLGATVKTKEGAYFTNNQYPYDTFVLASPVALTAGAHTITVALNGDSAGAAADYVKFVKVSEPAGISVSATDTELNVGETANISISGVNASEMYMVTYSSSDEAVAIVDGNGKITATGGGEAIIEVIVKKYVFSQGVSDFITVTVDSSELLTISGAGYSNGTFAARITKNGALSGSAQAYIAVYDNSTSRKLLRSASVTVPVTAGTQDISIPLSASEGNLIGVFVWDSASMQPLCEPTFVKIR